jgi:flagellar FliJ protein
MAFENLKKYEHVAEAAKVAKAKLAGKLETAALDELGLRRAAPVGGSRDKAPSVAATAPP